MAFRRVKAALIGSGMISYKYLNTITKKFHVLEMVGCSDLIPERSALRAKQFDIRQMTNEEIWNDPSIEIVLNTTYPLSHYEVTKRSLEAGKHVLTEKMVAVELNEGKELVELARSKGLFFISAPDTFLGGGWQTARHLLDSGVIGDPVAVHAACVRSYQDHSEEEALYKAFTLSRGGGIPFDMGGYYLHNMVNLLGPLSRVTGFMQTRRPQRPYTNPRHPRYGQEFTVDSPNTMTAALEFSGGVLGSLVLTSEGAVDANPGEETIPTNPHIEIHGTQGSLILFDPNLFSGDIYLLRNTIEGPVKMPILYPFQDECRGIGAADLAYAILNGRKPRADATLGYHAFEAIHGIWESSESGKIHTMESTCQRPAALPLRALAGTAYEAILDH
ncbi:Gfo/Idh/MocA family protein [Neglectibacter caecimuris]|uniref:Gfo/Idh/MocA family protein n=1 Tax=Neglectibacter caecimuris TaxID=3093658 RepID=UPI002AC9C14E|nr:Gfo/Idh/MocA family oxidoreductase [Neglectibacter sp. M00184]